jgi:hypothetical protein
MKPARITASFKKISRNRTLKRLVLPELACNGTFTETRGTIFYCKRTPEHQILETLALGAEGNRISSLTRAKGHKEDTILEWLRETATHAEQMEGVLMRDFIVKRGQLDALWGIVRRNKG